MPNGSVTSPTLSCLLVTKAASSSPIRTTAIVPGGRVTLGSRRHRSDVGDYCDGPVSPIDRGDLQARSGTWAHLGSNQGPLACEASALPLSYAPGRCKASGAAAPPQV